MSGKTFSSCSPGKHNLIWTWQTCQGDSQNIEVAQFDTGEVTMKISRRNFLKGAFGTAVVLGSSGLWNPRSASAATTIHECNWDYALGNTFQAICCGPGSLGGDGPSLPEGSSKPTFPGYNYGSLNPQKWHTWYTTPEYGDSVQVVNNPPSGSPTPNALKMSFNFNEKYAGSIVLGTDGKTYACKIDSSGLPASYVSGPDINSDSTRPITGGAWQTYWQLDPYNRTTSNVFQPNHTYWQKCIGAGNGSGVQGFAAPITSGRRVEMPTLPNPFYCRYYIWSQSLIDYAESGRKICYWLNDTYGSRCAMVELYNTNGKTNPSLPLAAGYDESAFIVIHNHPAGTNLGYFNKVNDIKLSGMPEDFAASYQPPARKWPSCPETGAQASDGRLTTGAWHCIEFAHYRHKTNGWVRAWLDGKMCINACKEAWNASSYCTLTTASDGVDIQPNWVSLTSVRNGGVVRNSTEYIAAWKVSGSYIGPVGSVYNPPGVSAPSNLRIIG